MTLPEREIELIVFMVAKIEHGNATLVSKKPVTCEAKGLSPNAGRIYAPGLPDIAEIATERDMKDAAYKIGLYKRGYPVTVQRKASNFDACPSPNAASMRAFVVEAKPQRKRR